MILASGSLLTDLLTGSVVLAYLGAAAVGSRSATAAKAILVIAWFGHAALVVLGLLGPEPRFGFAAALSMTILLVAAVYSVERQFYPRLPLRWTLSLIGAIAVLLPWMFPGSRLPAGASDWLPVHLALGIGSYGLFGAAVAHAVLTDRIERNMRHPSEPHQGVPLLTMERLTFKLVWAGFALLTATLLLAFTAGESLHGPNVPFRWDHKSVFSVLAWLVFAGLLVGRARYGWRGRRATRVLYAGSGLLFLAYVGSRFVLEVILGRAA